MRIALAWLLSAGLIVVGIVLLVTTEAQLAGFVAVGMGTCLFIVTMGLLPSKARAGSGQKAQRAG